MYKRYQLEDQLAALDAHYDMLSGRKNTKRATLESLLILRRKVRAQLKAILAKEAA